MNEFLHLNVTYLKQKVQMSDCNALLLQVQKIAVISAECEYVDECVGQLPKKFQLVALETVFALPGKRD